jgi:DNA-binding HxlR family transcriptional regulator
MEEGLVARKVLPTKPIRSNYSLTEKGRSVGKLISEINSLIVGHMR